MVNQEYLLIVTSSSFGEGTVDLAEKLMKGFFKTLVESNSPPARIIFMNAGVFLTTENSSVLEELRTLATQGVEIFSCTTCLNYFDRMDKLLIGSASNMKETVSSLAAYSKVVTI